MSRTFFRESQRLVTVVLLCGVAMLASAAEGYGGAGVLWQRDVGEAARKAARENKPMLIMVGATWCGPCHKMLDETFANPSISARLVRQLIPVLVDADAQSLLVEKLKIDAMPTLLVVNPDRKIVGRFTGFQTAAALDLRLASFAPQPDSEAARALVGRRSLSVSPGPTSKNPFHGSGQ